MWAARPFSRNGAEGSRSIDSSSVGRGKFEIANQRVRYPGIYWQGGVIADLDEFRRSNGGLDWYRGLEGCGRIERSQKQYQQRKTGVDGLLGRDKQCLPMIDSRKSSIAFREGGPSSLLAFLRPPSWLARKSYSKGKADHLCFGNGRRILSRKRRR